jgi:hypothetical protein
LYHLLINFLNLIKPYAIIKTLQILVKQTLNIPFCCHLHYFPFHAVILTVFMFIYRVDSENKYYLKQQTVILNRFRNWKSSYKISSNHFRGKERNETKHTFGRRRKCGKSKPSPLSLSSLSIFVFVLFLPLSDLCVEYFHCCIFLRKQFFFSVGFFSLVCFHFCFVFGGWKVKEECCKEIDMFKARNVME